MDEMMFYEIEDILANIPYLDRTSWEQCRLNTYFTSMIDHSKVKINDFIPFPWEAEENVARHTMTNEQLNAMKELEKLWAKGQDGGEFIYKH